MKLTPSNQFHLKGAMCDLIHFINKVAGDNYFDNPFLDTLWSIRSTFPLTKFL